MKTSKELPPNWYDIQKVLKIDPFAPENPIFCYGDTVYNVKGELRPDLDVHEYTHSQQQGDNPEIWWFKYLNDVKFRVEQEIEAYGNQYVFISRALKGKWLKYGLNDMAKNLSSDLYGSIISHNEAVSKIRNYAKNI